MTQEYGLADATRESLHVARHAAITRRDRSVEVEHMLLGVLEQMTHEVEHPGTSGDAELAALRGAAEALARQPTPRTRRWGLGLPYATSGKRALEGALRTARAMDAAAVQPQHLLLALVDECSGATRRLLETHGVTREVVRRLVR